MSYVLRSPMLLSMAVAALGFLTCQIAHSAVTLFPPKPRQLSGITFGNGKFVAVGWNNTIFTSADGTNWLNQSANIDSFLSGLNYEWQTYSYQGDSITLVLSDRAQVVSPGLQAVCWGSPGFVAVGANGTILFSPSAERWRWAVSGTSAGLRAVAWGGGKFVAVGAAGAIVSSPTG